MKKIVKKILAFASVAALTASIGLFVSDWNLTAANGNLNEEYVKGETIEIPDRTLRNGSSSKQVKPIVYAPSGKTYVTNSLLLREMGEYEVVYTAEIDGKTITETEEFRSISPIYTITGTGSYAYKANEKTPDTMGLNVELSSGSSFVYNKIIDLNELSRTDILKLYVVPETIGYCDFYQINVTLTDIYDPANQVIIEGNNVTDGYHDGIWDYEYAQYMMYMRAGTVLSTPRGFEGTTLHIGSYGYPSVCSFSGLHNTYSLQDEIFSFRLDYPTRRVIREGGVVVDLDDPAHFTDIWGGFTTGEVKLTISLSSFANATGTVVLTEIAGEKIGPEMTFYDSDAPELTVDYGEYTKETIPSAGVGNQYKLFDATANDSYSGKTEVVKKVFYDYEGAKEELPVENDAFIPTKTGKYTIEYTATDYCGNVAKETIELEVKTGYNLISATFESGTKQTAALAGEWTPLARLYASGGYGDLNTTVKAVDPDGKECEIVDGKILPVKAGAYQIVYTVTDYVNQKKTVRYEISVSANDKPVFIDEIYLNRYYMDGYSYELPLLQAYKADGVSLKPIDTKIIVTDSNSARMLEGRVYTPTINKDGTDVKIVYQATSDGKTVEKVYEGKGYVTKGSTGIQLQKFFITSSSISATSTSSALEYKTSTSGATMQFINPLLANSFSLLMNFSKMQSAAGIKFVLEDFENPDIKAEMKLAFDNGTYYLWVNGEKNTLSSFKPTAANDYYLLFDNLRSRVQIKDTSDNGIYFPVSEEGCYFPSGKVYLTIEFTDLTASNTLILKNLNGQNLKKMSVDLLRPSIDIFIETVGNKYEFGDVVVTSKAVGLDVLDPFVKTVMTVMDGQGNLVRDCMTGEELKGVSCDKEYHFMIEKYGEYTVSYQATDSQNRTATYQYVVSTQDEVAPVLELGYDIVEKAEINDYVYVPEGKGTDNVDGDVTVYYYIITPDGVVHAFNRDTYDGVKITSSGTYVIRYALYDQSGNLAVYDYAIQVK